jgi:hypothetical protein
MGAIRCEEEAHQHADQHVGLDIRLAVFGPGWDLVVFVVFYPDTNFLASRFQTAEK